MEARQTPVRIHRQDYAPFPWLVHETRLDVSINEPDTTVCVSLKLEANPAAQATDRLVLNGRGLTLVSVQLDGEVLAADRYQLDADTLQITGLIDQHEVTITSTCTPYSNTALEGLYLSGDMLCTQCEPEGFRRICYYPDRPDVMSVFTVRIDAEPKYKQLLSNGNQLEAGPAGEGRHYTLWHDPHPKPSYLFALV
ncbi:MAG TPA: aminopeptidase N, partial [Alphaproteobacteria bacterium]|nr:aminopeptidase N [Alphaproteobacteria bacterium]